MEQSAGAVILPTGSGKTRVAVLDVEQTEAQRVVYVAHSHEILQGAEEEFLKEVPADQIVRFDGRPTQEEFKRVNLVTIQSLVRNLDVFADTPVDYLVC